MKVAKRTLLKRLFIHLFLKLIDQGYTPNTAFNLSVDSIDNITNYFNELDKKHFEEEN